MRKLVILGAGGHGKVVVDIAVLQGYDEICFLDDDPNAKECLGFPVVGSMADISEPRDSEAFVAIGNAVIRHRMQHELERKGLRVATLVHPSAVIADGVSLGRGTVVMAGAVINPSTSVGKGCIVNTGATIDHDCVIGDFCHVSVGSHLAGSVTVESGTWIGIGAVVNNNVLICRNCMIGAGAVVVHDIEKPGTYVGVPAKKLLVGGGVAAPR